MPPSRSPVPSVAVLAAFVTGVLAPAPRALGVETQERAWRTAADFAPGEMDHVSVSAAGRLVLSPDYRRVTELDEPVAWRVVRLGSDLIVATGHDGKVLRVPADGGKPSVLLETDELEVHALAVASDGTVYAGTSPDGKVYRVRAGEAGAAGARKPAAAATPTPAPGAEATPAGGAEPGASGNVFFDPEERYIWAILPAPDGSIYVATGDKGSVYRVEPSGASTPVLTAEETHVLSLALAPDGTLYAGSGGNGYVYKVEKGGRTSILVDTAGSEVKALALDAAGNLYAASTGRPAGGPEANPLSEALGGAINATATLDDSGPGTYEAGAAAADSAGAGAGATAAAPVTGTGTPAPSGTAPAGGGGPAAVQAPAPAQTPPPIQQIALATILPGAYTPSGPRQSWLYRVRPDGLPEEIWRSGNETVHAMALFRGALALGTGDEGKVLLVAPDTGLASILLDFPGAQVTGLAATASGLSVVTSNLASVWTVEDVPAGAGTYTSPVVDAGHFATWGRLTVRATGAVKAETRSGNTEKPGARWSGWEDASSGIRSPQGRYVQYRLTLSAAGGGASGSRERGPEVKDVDLAFLPYNLAPRVRSITVLDPHVELVTSTTPQPGLAARRGSRIPPPLRARTRPASPDIKPAPREQETYGARSARFEADDPNGDDLLYTVAIRGEDEAGWMPLAKDLDEPFVAFDSTAFPDGAYQIRVTVTDRAANPDAQALSSSMESEPFVIDNTAPRVEALEATVSGEGRLRARARLTDAASVLEWAEYSLDGGDWRPLLPADRVFDQREETVEIDVPVPPACDGPPSGEHTLTVRAEDTGRNVGTAKTVVRAGGGRPAKAQRGAAAPPPSSTSHPAGGKRSTASSADLPD